MNYEHWFEVLLGGLVALGAWLFRLGRKYQEQESALRGMGETIKRLERDISGEVDKRSARDGEMYQRLRSIENVQSQQTAALAAIAASCEETRADVKELMRQARNGGPQA